MYYSILWWYFTYKNSWMMQWSSSDSFFVCVCFLFLFLFITRQLWCITFLFLHYTWQLTAPNQDFGMGSLYDLLLGPPPHPSSCVRHPNNVCLDVRNCFQLLLRVLLSAMFIVTSWRALSAWDFEYLSKTGLSRLTSGNLLKYLQFGTANQNLDLLL